MQVHEHMLSYRLYKSRTSGCILCRRQFTCFLLFCAISVICLAGAALMRWRLAFGVAELLLVIRHLVLGQWAKTEVRGARPVWSHAAEAHTV